MCPEDAKVLASIMAGVKRDPIDFSAARKVSQSHKADKTKSSTTVSGAPRSAFSGKHGLPTLSDRPLHGPSNVNNGKRPIQKHRSSTKLPTSTLISNALHYHSGDGKSQRPCLSSAIDRNAIKQTSPGGKGHGSQKIGNATSNDYQQALEPIRIASDKVSSAHSASDHVHTWQ